LDRTVGCSLRVPCGFACAAGAASDAASGAAAAAMVQQPPPRKKKMLTIPAARSSDALGDGEARRHEEEDGRGISDKCDNNMMRMGGGETGRWRPLSIERGRKK
jgi:hypothetical protein